MDENIAVLRRRLTELRDIAIDFMSRIASRLPKEMIEEKPTNYYFKSPVADVWQYMSNAEKLSADVTRSDIRAAMVDIGAQAQNSLLLDESDVRLLAQNAKTMTACLRFKMYKSWGINIHHDEGSYIGMDPPGQSEDDPILPEQARQEFQESYRKTIELLELMSAKRPKIGDQIGRSILSPQATLSYRPGTAFIMMWISPNEPQLNDVKDVVKEVFRQFNINAFRADEIEHSDGITDRIVEEIRQAEYLFADLTGERPSVYYEIGYAHAIGKPVILFRRKGTTIHFDLAYRNCPEYDNLGDLRNKMRARLASLTNRNSP
jgi:hypothetical protein